MLLLILALLDKWLYCMQILLQYIYDVKEPLQMAVMAP